MNDYNNENRDNELGNWTPPQNGDLKAAAEQIKAVLKKYDLAALITLQSRTHVEFVREISPSWSCMFFEKGDDGSLGVRFRSKLENFPSKEAQKECTERTLGLIFGFQHQADEDSRNMKMLIETFAPHFAQVTNRISDMQEEQ